MIDGMNNSTHLNGKAAPVKAPDPEVKPQKPTRRNLSAKQKLAILEEIDNLERGQVGSYLRRKGLYSSNISVWRKQKERGELDSQSPKKRGAKPKSAESRRLTQLERENVKLQRELEKAHLIIDVQKKLCTLFGVDSMTGAKLT
ncbi:MAG: hypothetical protein WC314_15885 [Vulcanimicrobiota bacterium]